MRPEDEAQLLEAAERNSGIDMVRARLNKSESLPSSETCVNCNEPIPQERRNLFKGVRLCIDCKSFSEKHGFLP